MKKIGLIFLLLGLTGCGLFGSDDKSEKPVLEKPAKEEVKDRTKNLICPQVAIVQEVQETADYGGEKPDPSQLVAKARMQHIEGDCAYRKDGIDIAFTLSMIAGRGQRLGSQVSFPYFVAVVAPVDRVLSRQVLTASFKFSGSEKTTTDDEPLHIFIPLSETDQQDGPDYRVLVGFQSVRQ